MIQAINRDEFDSRLNELDTPTDIIDREGRVLGRFIPASSRATPQPEDQCPYSAEELAKMQDERGGRPLSEIWTSLGRT
ncbi:hypothetical protein [Calycomorphotria hydatis]|uniref:Uncharacterized protein n=1 Tax=Calycomorphotria hydatis TaxID=2528027 RepID=A0A517TCZ8_9PLAN|nr:hypothetical protein [Calycomorphotria hydatis]QDT66247.1 hypothetical protein V22_35120 [Calycomorphotria hydatis]